MLKGNEAGGVGRSWHVMPTAHQEPDISASSSPNPGRGTGGSGGEKQFEKAKMGTEPRKLDRFKIFLASSLKIKVLMSKILAFSHSLGLFTQTG